MIEPPNFVEVEVFRRLAPRIGFIAALVVSSAAVPPPARAQTNIDQGKSSAEIFANDCAVCHKSTRGLAAGKNSLMLSGFLREHYTASREQAAALAAYVLGAGGNAPAAPGLKPEPARAAVEEPKNPARPGTASKGHKPEPEAAPPVQEPAAVVAAPAANPTPTPAEAPSQDVNQTTSAAAPTESQSGDSTPVPRDNIPD
jgi:hypothetical protein